MNSINRPAEIFDASDATQPRDDEANSPSLKRVPLISFYFHPTPNPAKVSLLLEETGLPYETVPVDTSRGEQHAPAFLAINPNGKVPAIVDTDGHGGREARVFDSTAILLYLSEKTGKFGGAADNRPELLSWLPPPLWPLSPKAFDSYLQAHPTRTTGFHRRRRWPTVRPRNTARFLPGAAPWHAPGPRPAHPASCRRLFGHGVDGQQSPQPLLKQPDAPRLEQGYLGPSTRENVLNPNPQCF